VQAKATDDQILKAVQDAKGIRSAAAAKLGMADRTLLARLKKMKTKGYIVPRSTYQPGEPVENADYSFTPLPEDDVSIEELVEQRKRKFAHKREYEEASKLIPIRIKINGPIGLLHFGDPHVDDDGWTLRRSSGTPISVTARPGYSPAMSAIPRTTGWAV
jgi:hypothetical protein